MNNKCSHFSPNSTVPLCARRRSDALAWILSSCQMYCYNLPSVLTNTCVSVQLWSLRHLIGRCLRRSPALEFSAGGETVLAGLMWSVKLQWPYAQRRTVTEKYARWVVVLRSARTNHLRGHTVLRTGEHRVGIHSPDCEKLNPNKRQVRRKPKQHWAVVGFIVVLSKYPL